MCFCFLFLFRVTTAVKENLSESGFCIGFALRVLASGCKTFLPEEKYSIMLIINHVRDTVVGSTQCLPPLPPRARHVFQGLRNSRQSLPERLQVVAGLGVKTAEMCRHLMTHLDKVRTVHVHAFSYVFSTRLSSCSFFCFRAA